MVHTQTRRRRSDGFLFALLVAADLRYRAVALSRVELAGVISRSAFSAHLERKLHRLSCSPILLALRYVTLPPIYLSLRASDHPPSHICWDSFVEPDPFWSPRQCKRQTEIPACLVVRKHRTRAVKTTALIASRHHLKSYAR